MSGSNFRSILLNKKVHYISLFVAAAAAIIFLIQTFGRAYRTEGFDLTSYLLSAEALLSGMNPYTTGSVFPFIYPLFLTVLLIPFLAIPYAGSVFIWFIISIFSLFVIIYKIFEIESGNKINTGFKLGVPLLFIFLLMVNVIQNNLLNGQVNIPVLLLSLLFFIYFIKGNFLLGGLFLGAAVSIKLVPLIFLLLAFKKGKLNLLLYTLLFTIFFSIALPYLFAGNNLFEFYNYYAGNFLISGVQQSENELIFTLNNFLIYIFPGLKDLILIKIISAGVIAAINYTAYIKYFERSPLMIFSLLSLSILLISPMSETHHLIFIIPAAAALAYNLFIEEGSNHLISNIFFGMFILLFWIGEISKAAPFHFLSLIILFSLLIIRLKSDGTAKQV